MTLAALSVVIPAWDHCDLLLRCLQSLDEQTHRPVEIVVVDDGSTEDVSRAAAAFAEVRVVRRDTNGGFCQAANDGIRNTTCPYILLLNNDMTLAADCIERLLTAAAKGPSCLLAPLVLLDSDRECVWSAGDRVLQSGRPEAIGFRMSREALTLPEAIFGVSGGAALYPREALEQVGLFDETFVAYFEDVDLCMRARLAGYSCALVPEARAYHVGSASLGGKTWWRSQQCFRNHVLLVLKNFPLPVLLRHRDAIQREIKHQARMLLTSARAEFGLARAITRLIESTVRIVAALPRALRERRRIQTTRAISADEFEVLLTPTRDAR